jgi:hypothetical protein
VPAGKFQALRVVWESDGRVLTSWYTAGVGEEKRVEKFGHEYGTHDLLAEIVQAEGRKGVASESGIKRRRGCSLRLCSRSRYPDAPHAFFADDRPSYKMDAAEDGWKKLLAFFKKNGVA